MKQIEYRVRVELDEVFSICYDENERHSEDKAIDYVFDNYMKEIKALLKRNTYVEAVNEIE